MSGAWTSVARAQEVASPDYPMRSPVKASGRRTVIVAVPGVGWADVWAADMPHLHGMIGQGAAGLMPVAKPSDTDPHRTWVTLGAGRAAVGVADMGAARPWGAGGFRTDLAPLAEANARANTTATVGLLGEMLRSHGLATAVIGDDADPPGARRCLGLVTLSDRHGRVDGGSIGRSLRGAGGLLDRTALRRALAEALSHCQVVLLALDDVSRADASDRPAGYGDLPEGKARALRACDEIIGDVLAAIAPYQAAVFVVSPTSPGYTGRDVRALGPFIVYAPGAPAGVLTSSSSRRPGLLAAADFAPTVLDRSGVPLPRDSRLMSGRVASVTGEGADLSQLDRLLSDRYRLRVRVTKWYVAYGVLVVIAGLALALARPTRRRTPGGVALGLAVVPVGLVIAGLAPPGWDAAYMAIAALIAVGLGLAATHVGGGAARGLALGLLGGAAVIALDVVVGSPLAERSALDVGAMLGSRFYGIGNEYMSGLVGMTVIGVASLLQARPRAARLATAIAVGLVLVIGMPGWGANWGGSFAAAAGFVALWLLLRSQIRTRHLLTAGAVLAASVLVPALVDLARPAAERSHIGSSAAALLSGNGYVLADVVQRKMAMSLGVLRAAPWIAAAAVIAAGTFWVLLREGGPARRALEGQHAVAAGIAASLLAAVVAMGVNDSGPAAGFGAVLAALGATVFLAAWGGEEAA